ncbi:hypothetical protein FB451DRAFT_1180063 [Mycena latifolia]|nr:hypothetical protein FB451DRAFT_1180063 [Mycena latifolia]
MEGLIRPSESGVDLLRDDGDHFFGSLNARDGPGSPLLSAHDADSSSQHDADSLNPPRNPDTDTAIMFGELAPAYPAANEMSLRPTTRANPASFARAKAKSAAAAAENALSAGRAAATPTLKPTKNAVAPQHERELEPEPTAAGPTIVPQKSLLRRDVNVRRRKKLTVRLSTTPPTPTKQAQTMGTQRQAARRVCSFRSANAPVPAFATAMDDTKVVRPAPGSFVPSKPKSQSELKSKSRPESKPESPAQAPSKPASMSSKGAADTARPVPSASARQKSAKSAPAPQVDEKAVRPGAKKRRTPSPPHPSTRTRNCARYSGTYEDEDRAREKRECQCEWGSESETPRGRPPSKRERKPTDDSHVREYPGLRDAYRRLPNSDLNPVPSGVLDMRVDRSHPHPRVVHNDLTFSQLSPRKPLPVPPPSPMRAAAKRSRSSMSVVSAVSAISGVPEEVAMTRSKQSRVKSSDNNTNANGARAPSTQGAGRRCEYGEGCRCGKGEGGVSTGAGGAQGCALTA